jgi:two-component system sensor histidine kinase YesM
MNLKYSLRHKLTVIYLFTILFPVVIIIFFMPYYYQTLIAKETSKLTETIVSSLIYNIQTYLDDLQNLTITPYLSNEMMYTLKLKASNQYELADEYTKSKAEQALIRTLPLYMRNTRKDILGTVLIPFDDSVYISSAGGSNDAKPDYRFKEQDWYKKALKADGRVVFISGHPQDYLKRTVTSQVFSVARLIKDPDSKRPLAVIMADADTIILHHILQQIELNVRSIVAIFDDEDNLLYANQVLTDSMEKQAADGNSEVIGLNDSYTVVSKSIPTANWKMVVLLSNNDLKSKVWWMYIAGILFALGGLLLALLLFTTLSRWIILPFKQMINVMRKVQNGDLSSRINIQGKDEISHLGLSFNLMISRLEELIDHEYRSKLNLRNAEYRALQSQIQPHFLYNTLNGFIGLNRKGEQKVLERYILDLSALMRYILEHNDSATIEEEFRFLQKYCQLQHMRFQDRLQADVFYSDGIKEYRIPKLLLQPIVENAIIHGIEPSDKPCTLMITAEIIELNGQQILQISIVDNGVGFDTKKLLTYESIGLANVRERLAIAFHHQAQVHIQSQPGIGTTVRIEISMEEVYRYENISS